MTFPAQHLVHAPVAAPGPPLMGYFLGADMVITLPWNESFHSTQGDPPSVAGDRVRG
ncbi:hypothetical protein [Arcanobacterium haemolyticum]